MTRRMASDPKVKMKELRTVCQKVGSSKMRRKFVSPTKCHSGDPTRALDRLR